MDLIESLHESQYRVVEAGGLRWRIRAVDDAEALARHGSATLLTLPVEALREAGMAPDGLDTLMATLEEAQQAASAIEEGRDVTEQERERVLDALAKVQRMAVHVHPRQREEQAVASEALVCAGVVGVWDPDRDDWRTVRFVRGKAEPDPVAGVLHVRSIRPILIVLANAISTASTDARGWTAALDAFRRGPGAARAGGPDRDAAQPHDP